MVFFKIDLVRLRKSSYGLIKYKDQKFAKRKLSVTFVGDNF